MAMKTLDRSSMSIFPFLKELRSLMQAKEEFTIKTAANNTTELPKDLQYLLKNSTKTPLPPLQYQSPIYTAISSLLVITIIWLALSLANRGYEFELARDQNGTIRIKGTPKKELPQSNETVAK